MRQLVTTIAAAAAMLLAAGAAATAQTPGAGPAGTAGIPSRVELHPLPSLTLSDRQFLTGDRAGDARPVTVTGEFRIAQGSGRLPVVVLMHGSGGMGPNIRMWADQLNAMGISTFAIDGLTGRGLASVNTNQAALGRLNFILDIYAALDLLAKHPRVDPARIALMGFSRGGQAALYASLERFHRAWNRSGGAGFAGYVAFYPDCATAYREDAEVVAAPIRILHGTADDYNPLATCRAYAGRLREAGRDVGMTEYPGAHHGFDSPIGPVPAAVSPGAQTVRACTIRETEPGVLVNTATGQPFTYGDACVQRDPHVGPDAEARAAAQREVGDFLRTLFALR